MKAMNANIRFGLGMVGSQPNCHAYGRVAIKPGVMGEREESI